MRARRRTGTIAALAVFAVSCAAVLATGATAVPGSAGEESGCPVERTSAAEASRLLGVLGARRDVWGEELLARPGGPTYGGAAAFLRPLTLARAAKGKPLTGSGTYALAFGVPTAAQGTSAVALHVADGSAIVSRREGGPSLTVRVGPGGAERYGACRARIEPARLAGGWLPVLQTGYVDAAGARYEQESFATRPAGVEALVSFVRITVDTRRARSAVTVRLVPSRGAGSRLIAAVATQRIPAGTTRTLHAAWLGAPGRKPAADGSAYDAARAATVAAWNRRLARGMQIDVPEQRVANAARALRVQQLLLTWRYSVGNQYEQFSFPEALDAATALAEQGLAAESRAVLLLSLTRPAGPYPNWRKGVRLLAFAAHWRLHRNRALLRQATPALRGYVAELDRQLRAGKDGLLDRERFSSDIPDAVYGLHSQATVWAGLRAIAHAWREAGDRAPAAQAAGVAARLGPGLRRAAAAGSRRLADGSLFVPARLRDGERPYGSVTEERAGSYWNLVMPYAFATGLFAPESPEARGILRYLERHGAWLLGTVRAGAYSLYAEPRFPTGGINPVYGLSLARFLADNDEAGRLVLALYGQLAAAMAQDTFVSGEAVSVAPLPGTVERATYLPPNGAAGAAFLTTLRSMLVHETRDLAGRPLGLRLAFATPRAWLRPGRRVAVRDAPTSFGPVSYSIAAGARGAEIVVEAPRRPRPRALALRLRVPAGTRIARVMLGGRPYARFDPATATIDLTGRTGTIRLSVVYRQAGA